MKKSILLAFCFIGIFSCSKSNEEANEKEEACNYKSVIMTPNGYDVNVIGEIDFSGSVVSFQFVNESVGFCILSNFVGGKVELFKTINGGADWTNMNIGINQHPRGMIFKDENIGIITVLDTTGCPPPNCLNKCVILRTQDGGITWDEIEIEQFKGSLNHPQYDSEGSLYANLRLDNESTLIRSLDDGISWDTLYSSPQLGYSQITYSFEIFEDWIFVSGKNKNIFVVDIDGSLIKEIELEKNTILDVEVIDKNNLIVVLSGEIIRSSDGGETWDTIYDQSARMIGFDSANEGLVLLQKDRCETDTYLVNDMIASTIDGGDTWIEPNQATSNLMSDFAYSQKIEEGLNYIFVRNQILEIKR